MKRIDSSLNEALIKSYVARAKLFYSVLKSKNIKKLFARVEKCAIKDITWNIEKLNISKEAFIVTKKVSIPPHMIFCHPEILNKCPILVEYYRSLTALSQKGLSSREKGTVLFIEYYKTKTTIIIGDKGNSNG
jgi:hypothetical protein